MDTSGTEERGRADTAGFHRLTRRRLLRLGLLGTGAFAATGAAGLLELRGWAPAVDGLRVLDRFQYRTLAAIADTLIPHGGAFLAGASDFDLARQFDGYLANEPRESLRTFKRALHLVEFGPVIFEWRWVTFSHLEPAARLLHWRQWECSEQLLRRQVAMAFRRFLYTTFYDQPEVWPAIGYPGPAISRGEPSPSRVPEGAANEAPHG